MIPRLEGRSPAEHLPWGVPAQLQCPRHHLVSSVFSLTWGIRFRSKATPKSFVFWHTWHQGAYCVAASPLFNEGAHGNFRLGDRCSAPLVYAMRTCAVHFPTTRKLSVFKRGECQFLSNCN